MADDYDIYADDGLGGAAMDADDDFLYGDLGAPTTKETPVEPEKEQPRTSSMEDVLDYGVDDNVTEPISTEALPVKRETEPSVINGTAAHDHQRPEFALAQPQPDYNTIPVVDGQSYSQHYQVAGSKALLVEDLTWWTSDEDIKLALSEAGVLDSLIPLELAFSEHRVNGKSKGVCFLLFTSTEATMKAKEFFEQIEIHGRKATVKVVPPGQTTNPFRTVPKDPKEVRAEAAKRASGPPHAQPGVPPAGAAVASRGAAASRGRGGYPGYGRGFMPGFFPEAPEFFPPPLMGGAFPPEGPAFRGGFGRGMRGGYAGQPGGMYDRPPYGAGGFYDGSPDMEFDGYGGYARGRGFARPYPGPPRSGVRDTEEPRSSSASRRDESRDYDARSSVHEDAAERESVTDRPKAEVASNAPESLNGAAATSETPVDAAPKPEDVHADRRASARRPSDAGSGYYSHRDRHHGYSEDRGYYDHSRRGGYPPYDQHHPGREYEKYDRPDKYEKYGKYGYDRDYYGRDRESRRPEASSSVYVKERDYSRDREKDYSGSRRDGSRSRDKDRSERRSRKSSRERRGDRERDQEDRRRDEDYPLEAEPKLEENETQPMDGMKQEQSPEPSGTPRRLSISSAVSQGDRDREKESRSSSRSHRKRRPSKSPSRSRSRSRSVDEDRRKRRRERRERKDKDRERRHRRRRDRDGERDDKDRERDDRERV